MTDWPMLFTPENVRKLSDGLKTQTRRIMTRRNTYYDGDKWPKKDFAWVKGGHDEERWDEAFVDKTPHSVGMSWEYLQLPVYHFNAIDEIQDRTTHRIYPRVQVDDLFWVKEPWAVDDCYDHLKPSEIPPDEATVFTKAKTPTDSPHDTLNIRGKWRLARYMPKVFCGLWLKVNRIRIERLQDISEEDAIAEGCKNDVVIEYQHPGGEPIDYTGLYAVERFEALWNSIHKDKHPWESNKWVVAYDVERVPK